MVTCSCPSCQHQTSVTAAGWVLGAHCAPVSRLQLGYNSIPTADWVQAAAGLGAAAGAALASVPLVLVLVAAFPYISSLFVARRPSPPRPPHPPRPAPQRHRCGPVRVDSTQQRGSSVGPAAAQWKWDWKLRSFLALDCRLGF